MWRREFLSLVGGAAALWPLPSRAQTSIRRIGFLGTTSPSAWAAPVEALRSGLRERGYVEGENFTIEFRWADGQYDQLDRLALELARLGVEVIVTHGTPGTLAAKRATSSIPIVMAVSGDAVATGIVTNLARPEANVTGSSFFATELAGKRLGLLRELAPEMTKAAVLVIRGNALNGPVYESLKVSTRTFQLGLEYLEVAGPKEFEAALAAAASTGVNGVVLTEDALIVTNAKSIAHIALRNRLLTAGPSGNVREGVLIGYGPNLDALYRYAAYFLDRILKGAKPADLPVGQPTSFEFAINLKTAKELGVTVPPMIISQATEIFE